MSLHKPQLAPAPLAQYPYPEGASASLPLPSLRRTNLFHIDTTSLIFLVRVRGVQVAPLGPLPLAISEGYLAMACAATVNRRESCRTTGQSLGSCFRRELMAPMKKQNPSQHALAGVPGR